MQSVADVERLTQVTPTHDEIRALLAAGDMTSGEIALFFGVRLHNISKCLHHMRTAAAPTIHITRWTREGIGKRYLRAVYRLGPGRNAKKPDALSNADVLRGRRERRSVKPPEAPVSVWNWAERIAA